MHHSILKPELHLANLLQCVARGQQDEANKLLTLELTDSKLQLETGVFTDYSGRTFECSAYEYAYWAKDTHMCRMLESHMNEETKSIILKRCIAIDRTGLTFRQHGVVVNNSIHFDFTPLKTALEKFVQNYDHWTNTKNWDAMETAWMEVGRAQRDVPVHVANEYCRRDRPFNPLPAFNEDSLPRDLTFYDYATHMTKAWFPLIVSDLSGLGVVFAILRANNKEKIHGRNEGVAGAHKRVGPGAVMDLAAINRLDEVRTADLAQSRENLKPKEPELELGMSSPPQISSAV